MNTSPTKSFLLIVATFFPALTGATVASTQTLDTTYRPSKTMFAAKRANVRSGPGTRYSKVGVLEIGQLAIVTAKTGNWFKLAPRPEQTMRFVYAPLLTETRPATAGAGSTEPAGPRRTIHNSGSRYHGHTRNGRPHGQGVMTYASGNRYEGGFVNGRREGRGVFTWANGTRYEGEFVDGKRTGRGILTWPNGARHEGHWSSGDRHGEGWVILTDGTGYRGTWRNDKVGRRDYRRESWESDRLRWLRESGFESPTNDTTGKDLYWAVAKGHILGTATSRPFFGAAWNASTAEEAEKMAIDECQKKGPFCIYSTSGKNSCFVIGQYPNWVNRNPKDGEYRPYVDWGGSTVEEVLRSAAYAPSHWGPFHPVLQKCSGGKPGASSQKQR